MVDTPENDMPENESPKSTSVLRLKLGPKSEAPEEKAKPVMPELEPDETGPVEIPDDLTEQDYHRARRNAARLAAIQALYENALLKTAKPASELLEEALEAYRDAHREADTDRDFGIKPNKKLLAAILEGVEAQQDALDDAIRHALTGNWRFERLGAVLTAILRSGAFEVIRGNVPATHLLAEYVELTGEFFDDPELGMVNAVLEKLAKTHAPIPSANR